MDILHIYGPVCIPWHLKRPRETSTSSLIICAAMKKIVLRICIACSKCKTCVMKAVAKVQGINEISVDAEKGLLTVIGDVDPVVIVKELKKVKKFVSIDTVGPYKKEEPKKKEPEPCKPLPSCCNACQPIAIGYLTYDDPVWCTIL